MERAPKDSDEPVDRLFKLLPAESTAAFLLLRAIFPIDQTSENFKLEAGIFYGLVAVILVCTPLLLTRVWGVSSRLVVGFVTASFVIWALNIDIDRVKFIAGLLADEIWTGFDILLHPMFIRGSLVVWAIVLVPLIIPKKNRNS